MRNFILPLLIFFLPLNLYAKNESPCDFLNSDMLQMANKMEKALRRCALIKSLPNIVISLRNQTNQFVDQTKFAELIHSNIEKKSHAKAEEKEPDLEIQATLSESRRAIHLICKSTYTLSAVVSQSGEELCRKSVKILKIGRASP